MLTDLSANQPPPHEPYNLFTSDPVLVETISGEGAGDDGELLAAFDPSCHGIAERAVPQR